MDWGRKEEGGRCMQRPRQKIVQTGPNTWFLRTKHDQDELSYYPDPCFQNITTLKMKPLEKKKRVSFNLACTNIGNI